MTTQTSTTLKTAGVNVLALLAAYLMQKVSDKNTKFADTRAAATDVVLQAAQEIIANQRAKAAASAVTAAEDNTAQAGAQ